MAKNQYQDNAAPNFSYPNNVSPKNLPHGFPDLSDKYPFQYPLPPGANKKYLDGK